MGVLKVLIVEDDPMVADINKNFTEAVDGFKVIGTASDGKQALEIITKNMPDLVILDIYMPKMDGLELLYRLRNNILPVDIILITAANDSSTIDAVMRGGIFDYLVKPFKFERYRAALTSYYEYKQAINKKQQLNQEDIDKVLVFKKRLKNTSLPKNFHEHTLTKIYEYITINKIPQSADEVAAGVGVSRVTARRYLEFLVSEGHLSMFLDYLSVGRPIHRYTKNGQI